MLTIADRLPQQNITLEAKQSLYSAGLDTIQRKTGSGALGYLPVPGLSNGTRGLGLNAGMRVG
jgi:hypothetical protein